MSSSGSSSVRVVPSASSKGTQSERPYASISGSSSSGIPIPVDAKSQKNLEIMKSCHDVETTAKRPTRSLAPDQATVGQLEKQVKIVMRKHKSRHGEGSSRTAAQEKELEAPAEEDSSLSYRRPRSMKDLCAQGFARMMKEIVYPCIPDPDGEDEGGQASSSLAVSTRWISAMKLLQSDLVTLTQREGGE
ncbi:hypothetical protein B296_00030911 [Ensete ventricosum]|uniref:Uncharacterized protein n=1 Tax=Ensete ventricosum TaxID=4639 RepID=A0A426X6G7_ENSVE|nr:hypothetical protein B296_00030911 [Ensete ventricosum]